MAYKENQVDDRKWIVYTSDDDHNIDDFLIPDYSVTADKLAPNSVTSQKIVDGAITAQKISSLPTMSATIQGGAKLGSGLEVTDDVLSTTSRFYETVADMQADTTLTSGMICHTNGFHTSGDGGAAFYKITASGTANGMDVIALENGMYAELNIDQNLCPEQLGAYGDASDYSDAAIAKAIELNPYHLILANSYKILHGISIPNDSFVDGGGYIRSDSECFSLDNVHKIKIQNLRLYPTTNAIHITTDAGSSDYISVENIFAYGTGASDSCGILIERTTGYLNESKWEKCTLWNFEYGIRVINPNTSIDCNDHLFIECSTETSLLYGQYIQNSSNVTFAFNRSQETGSLIYKSEGICNKLLIIGSWVWNVANTALQLSSDTNGMIIGKYRSGNFTVARPGNLVYIVKGKAIPPIDSFIEFNKNISVDQTVPQAGNELFCNFNLTSAQDVTLTFDSDYYGGSFKINEIFIRKVAWTGVYTLVFGNQTITLPTTNTSATAKTHYLKLYYSSMNNGTGKWYIEELSETADW